MRLGRSRDAARVLCAGLSDRGIDVILMAREHDSFRVLHTSHADVPVSRSMTDPGGLGLALRSHLDSAGISAHSVIACVPAAWCFSTWLTPPGLSEDDTQAYIATQAERCLPVMPGEVAYASCIYETAKGQREVHLLAMPAPCISSVETLLTSAGLRPIAITVGAAHLLPAQTDDVHGVLHVSSHFAEFAVGTREALLAVHDLCGAVETACVHPMEEARRELHMTLHRLPQGIRESLHSVTVLGPRDSAVRWANALSSEFHTLHFDVGERRSHGEHGADCARPDLMCAAQAHLEGQPLRPDFLPARMSRISGAIAFVQRRRTVSLLAAVLAAALLLVGAFGSQAHRLARLETDDVQLAGRAEELGALQDSIKHYQSWFDDDPSSLQCMSDLTRAFPAEGSMWLRALRIKERTQVTCSGNASSTGAWLKTLDAVRNTGGISDLAVSNIRGESPVEFSFTYRRQEGHAQ